MHREVLLQGLSLKAIDTVTGAQRGAIVLLSGGLDSATVIAIARERGFAIHALSFDYGQRHRIELECAKAIARRENSLSHRIVHIDAGIFRNTSLVNEEIGVPKDRPMDDSIPSTYVPARNLLFLSYALSLAESIGARHIFIGANAVDYSGYPDCRPEFIRSFEETANLGTKAGISGDPFRIEAPLIDLTKGGIIREGLRLNVDYSLTNSCYDPAQDGRPCGHCDSCLLRAKGFEEAGLPDPLTAGQRIP
jgi:7-cyano-7-deazaguanine synthase